MSETETERYERLLAEGREIVRFLLGEVKALRSNVGLMGLLQPDMEDYVKAVLEDSDARMEAFDEADH